MTDPSQLQHVPPADMAAWLLRERGLTYPDIARLVGVHHRTVRRWMNAGVQPSPLARQGLEALYQRYVAAA